MNFHTLREVFNIFKKKLKCNKCNKSFSNRTIQIKDVKKNRVQFECNCKQCGNKVFAEVNLVKTQNKPTDTQRVHQSLQLKTKKTPIITQNDVLDVKNFLKTFKGDFKEIFKKQ